MYRIMVTKKISSSSGALAMASDIITSETLHESEALVEALFQNQKTIHSLEFIRLYYINEAMSMSSQVDANDIIKMAPWFFTYKRMDAIIAARMDLELLGIFLRGKLTSGAAVDVEDKLHTIENKTNPMSKDDFLKLLYTKIK